MMQRVMLRMRHRLGLEELYEVEDRLIAISVRPDWDCVSVEMDAIYVEADVDDTMIYDYGMLEEELAIEFGHGPDADVTVDEERTMERQREVRVITAEMLEGGE